ncbi:MAG: transposase [Proteobacteria bacterium]|nr:transposase [Pseudomonadota bacterium]
MLLTRFKTWLDNTVHSVLPKDSLGEAVHYSLKHWSALTKFTEAGHLDASNNYAERCMRAVAVGRTDQPVTVRCKRMGRRVGRLDDKDISRLNVALAFVMGLAD